MRPFNKQKTFTRNKEGKILIEGTPKSWNNDYKKAVVKYLNCLEPLFDKAQEISDFQFILTLLRVRGIQGSGEDPYDNSIETINALMDIHKRIKGRARLNVFLWVYGQIIESSEPYETIANLLNIISGKTYSTFNYPYKKTRFGYSPQSPIEKIKYLEKLASENNMDYVLDPIKEIFDKDLRNAVFHSDYSVYKGEVFINKPQRIYRQGEALLLINKALAYHEAMKNLINTYTKSYNEPKVIDTTPGFSPDPNEKAQVIVRKNHGVIALRATMDKSNKNKVMWEVGNYLSYEPKLIQQGVFLLPPNKVDFWNKVLEKIPNPIYKPIENFVSKHFINK